MTSPLGLLVFASGNSRETTDLIKEGIMTTIICLLVRVIMPRETTDLIKEGIMTFLISSL